MFDGVHAGHRHLLGLLLRQARGRGLRPVVVTFDRHPRLVLGGDASGLRLLSTPRERLERIRECGVRHVLQVPFTREMAALSACDFVRHYLAPRVRLAALALGYDNRFGSTAHNDFDQLPLLAREMGFDIVRDEPLRVDGVEVSSTKIRRMLAAGDVEGAARMLGAHYAVTGAVAHGRGVGRTLGFPTANIVVDCPHKALPMEGVYAVEAAVQGRTLRGMANLGVQPTFGESAPAFETHLFDFSGDLYGQPLTVRFLRRLRATRAFDTPGDLARQLVADMENALQP